MVTCGKFTIFHIESHSNIHIGFPANVEQNCHIHTYTNWHTVFRQIEVLLLHDSHRNSFETVWKTVKYYQIFKCTYVIRMFTTVINCSWPAPRKLSERVLHKIQLLFLSVDYYFNSLLHEFQLLFLLSTTILRKFLEIFYFKVLFEFNYYFKDYYNLFKFTYYFNKFQLFISN